MEFSWAMICSSVGLELSSGADRARGGVDVTISAGCSPQLSPGAAETLFTEVCSVFSARLTFTDGSSSCSFGLLSAPSVKLSTAGAEMVPTDEAALAGLAPPCEGGATIAVATCLMHLYLMKERPASRCILRTWTWPSCIGPVLAHELSNAIPGSSAILECVRVMPTPWVWLRPAHAA